MSWPVCKITDVFDVARGGSPRPIQNYLTDSPNGLNWIMISDASDDSKYIKATRRRIKRAGLQKTRMVYEGDFLLTNSMSFGRPYILKTSGCIHDGWLVLSPKNDQVFPDFFYYLLGSDTLYREFTKRAAGAVVKNLNSALVRDVEIPLPPLAEQKRIAGILDAADALRAKRRESLAQLDTLLQSTFLEMFGDPVADAKRWKQLEGATSADWLLCTVGDQVTLQRGKDITKKAARPGNVPVISSGGVSFFHDEPFTLGPGVLLGRKGSVGKVHFSTVDFWPHDTTLYVKDFKGNVPRYVYHFFRQFPISDYEASAANPSLNRNNLHPVAVRWPPLDLQHRFAAIVESVERQKATQRSHLEELDTLFASLQSRAFRGDL